MINTFAYINRKARERYEVYSQKDCKYPQVNISKNNKMSILEKLKYAQAIALGRHQRHASGWSDEMWN